ncbi:MAG: 6-pyruvoyl-tetrahydropterin synthase-related protein [Chloroflexota bacterium]|nr:6-pyruvoyl-tetrahydropterin synthase-related protein [Chloroflexota bacterium]
MRLGPTHFYADNYFADYPPAFLYVLWLLAALFDGEALRLAVKAVSIPADVAIALISAAVVWRHGSPGRAVLAAALWSFAPGAVIAGPYWGQVDAVGTLVALLALLSASARRWVLAGALAGIASILKFQFGLALVVVGVAAAIEAYRLRSWRPLLVFPVAAAAAFIVALGFDQGPLRLWAMLRFAGEEYQLTSLYAFNIWSIVAGFLRPDDPYVVLGGILLGAAVIASCVPLWWRRDAATLLAAGAVATLAFYFLPTRAHERYLFPALALLVPFAAARPRVLAPYLGLSVAFALTLVFALSRTVFTDVRAPAWLDATLFRRDGQIAIAVFMLVCALACALLVSTLDASLVRRPIRWERPARRLLTWVRGRGRRLREDALAAVARERASARRVQHAVLAAVLALPMLFNAVALLPEVTVAVPSNNDDANHFGYVQRANEALARGEDPFDFWMPEMELGFAPFVYYQHLPHLAIVALYRALFGTVDLFTLFNVVRWLLLVTLPLTVWWSLRRMGASAPAAVLAGAAAGLLSGDGRFGLEYESFVWRGWGMYTQLWAAHLAFLSLAAVHELLERGRGLLRTILVLSALALSHLIYAYMTAISVVVLLIVLGVRRREWRVRLTRLGLVGAAVAVITSYMWLPFLAEKAYLNVSQPYLPRWRFDSFGIGPILTWLASGDLIDHARLPALTLLLAVGIGVAIRWRERLAVLSLALLAVWVVLWSGRTTLGPLADLLPLSSGLHVHRFVGSVDIAAIMLVGVGAGAVWRVARADASTRRALVAGGVFGLLLVPALVERADYYGWNTRWMTETRDAIARDRDVAAVVDALEDLPVARTYAGITNDWSKTLEFVPFNSVRFADLLNFARLPRVAKPYASLALNGDLTFHFNDTSAAQYDVLNARYAVARTGTAVPSFLFSLRTVGAYTIYGAPTSGWVAFAATTTRETVTTDEKLFFRIREWFVGPGPAARAYVRYDYPAASDGVVGSSRAWCANGRVAYERAQRDSVEVLVGCDAPAALVLKVTYHPNWRVTVDDRPVQTFMVSPGFIGIELPAGQHFVTAHYESTPVKTPLLVLGVLTVAGFAGFRRIRGPLQAQWSQRRARRDPLAPG